MSGREPVGDPPVMITRRELKHAVLRAHHARAMARERDDRMPRELHMHSLTLEDLLIDGDRDEAFTLDFIALTFMGVPMVVDPRVPHGEVHVLWPEGATTKEAPRG